MEKRYYTDNEFEEGVLYEFHHPLGWTFKSEVARDKGKETGHFYTTNKEEMGFRADSIYCSGPSPR